MIAVNLVVDPPIIGIPSATGKSSPIAWLPLDLVISDVTGVRVKRSVFSNVNDEIQLDVDEGQLVGRTDGGRGPAQHITVVAPLIFANGELSVDVDALTADLQQQMFEQRWIG